MIWQHVIAVQAKRGHEIKALAGITPQGSLQTAMPVTQL